jgi:sec-independent protein translocase protein TatA
MGGFSLIHWLVLGLIILLLFGGNRFSSMMGDVAKGLKGFKQGLADEPAATSHPIDSQQSAALQKDTRAEVLSAGDLRQESQSPDASGQR